MHFIYYYLLIINLLGLLIFFHDKQAAKKHKRRISEKRLWLIILFGGSLGAFSGMYLFHHKTKHLSFVILIPIILVIQIIGLLYLFTPLFKG